MSDDDLTMSRPRASAAVAPRLEGRLVVVFPDAVARAHRVDGATVFGRKPGEGVVVDDTTASRRHVEIDRQSRPAGFLLKDLGSRNGTWVDGAKVGERPVQLGHNALVRIGDVLAVFEQGDDLDLDGREVSRRAIPGGSLAARRLRSLVQRAAGDPSPVLLLGETGTGKEWAARELHRLSGRRGDLVPVNCAALAPELAESQLFGHMKGAFTGAHSNHDGLFRAAHGGTLFLDEVADLRPDLQAKLLRAIQEREVRAVGATRAVPVDVRVVAATHPDLLAKVESGDFRRDLYARLALWQLPVPSLAERRADVLDWLRRLHGEWLEARPDQPRDAFVIGVDVAERLLNAIWPENLRGLDRLVHQLATRPRGGPIALGDVAELKTSTVNAPKEARRPAPDKAELQQALADLGSVRAVAKHYGRDRRQVYRWMDQFGLRE